MLDLVWLVAAIELNGGLVSRGDRYALTENKCVIESKALHAALSETARADHRQGSALVFKREQCQFEPAETLLRLQLPLESLASRRIQFGTNASLMSVTLLHDRARLQNNPDYQSQPVAENIPAAAFDLFLGSGLQGAALSLSHGPRLATFSAQRNIDGKYYTRGTAEHLFESGGLLQAGDLRTTLGIEQRFTELRGLLLTNKAPILRSEGRAEAALQVPLPSRIQFYDRHGTPIYASEILAPGNYQIQGYGASNIPGFLEARLIDINGQTQRIFLPWSADRRLLSRGTTEWEVAGGNPRDASQQLSNSELLSARLHYGLGSGKTIGIRADQFDTQRRLMSEISSRVFLGAIGTLAAGKSCATERCIDLLFIETRAAIGRRAQLITSLGQTATISTSLAKQTTGQLSLTGALNARTSAAFHVSMIHSADQAHQRSHHLSLNFRVTPRVHLQAQLRSDASNGLPSRWFGYMGLSFVLPNQQSTVNTSLGFRGTPTPNESRQVISTEITAGRPDPFKPTISLTQTQEKQARSQAFLRYPAQFGDVSVRADSMAQSAAWSASTRLWLTPKGFRLGRPGEDNLVIQDIGIPAVKIHQAGRDVQVTNQEGLAFFSQVPPWTEARFTLDPRTIPFGVNLATNQIRIPIANYRAYVVSSRATITEAQVWRLAEPENLMLENYRLAIDRRQRRIFISPDGYVDLQSQDALPIQIHLESGQWAECRLVAETRPGIGSPNSPRKERLLQCEQTSSRDPQTASSLPSRS
jgi:hypothetical protein